MKPEDIWYHIEKNGPNDCWIWKRGKANYGYGVARIFKRGRIRVHRLIWELTNGKIPDGLFVLHNCDNPPCCNPDHLFLGTQKDNIQDMIRKGRRGKTGYKPGSQIGEKNYQSKLTNKKVLEIKRLLKSGLSHSKIASRFDVCRSNITLINTGIIWNSVIMED